jgi:hypothetical protein
MQFHWSKKIDKTNCFESVKPELPLSVERINTCQGTLGKPLSLPFLVHKKDLKIFSNLPNWVWLGRQQKHSKYGMPEEFWKQMSTYKQRGDLCIANIEASIAAFVNYQSHILAEERSTPKWNPQISDNHSREDEILGSMNPSRMILKSNEPKC